MKLKDKYGSIINFYQSKIGQIIISFGEVAIPLTKNQIDKLSLDVYSIEDFNLDDYKKFYKQKGVTNFKENK